MPSSVDEAIRVLEKLLDLFRLERNVYLGVTFVAVILLIVAFCFAIAEGDVTAAVGMCGSGGAIAYSSSRLLAMWDEAFKLMAQLLTAPSEKTDK